MNCGYIIKYRMWRCRVQGWSSLMTLMSPTSWWRKCHQWCTWDEKYHDHHPPSGWHHTTMNRNTIAVRSHHLHRVYPHTMPNHDVSSMSRLMERKRKFWERGEWRGESVLYVGIGKKLWRTPSKSTINKSKRAPKQGEFVWQCQCYPERVQIIPSNGDK